MKRYCIYKATNKVNGKVYIGFARNLTTRKNGHKQASLKGEDTKFYRAIRKYGWKAFDWQQLFVSTDAEYMLNEMEPHFIAQYNSFCEGYNSTLGGDGTIGYKHTEASKARMKAAWTESKRKALSNFRKGKYFASEDGKERTRQAHLGAKRNRSDEHKNKLQKQHQKYWYVTPLGRFCSIREASKVHADCSINTIRNRCMGITHPPEGNWNQLGFYTEPA